MQIDDGVRQVRSIWISDVHQGRRGCQAELLLDFPRRHESEYLYLVGDIVDGWWATSSMAGVRSGTGTGPNHARWKGCSIATTAIGSNPAQHWSNWRAASYG
jgi:UDP-2,3-diacylglucosamine pyrophosphatase LpxH